MTYKITIKDEDKIKAIVFESKSKMTPVYVQSCFNNCKQFGNELKNLDIIYRAESKTLIKIYDYFINNKLCNPFLFFQDKLISSRSHAYNKVHIDFFTSGIKANKYIPEPGSISKIIHHSLMANKVLMNSLINLSMVTPDEEERVINFLYLIKQKISFKFDSIEKEQLKKLWDKHFSEHTRQKHSNDFFEIVPTEKDLSYIEEESGYFYSVIVDCDKLSLTNQISHSKNSETFNYFFRGFIAFISENPDNYLSIKSVELKDRDIGYSIRKKEAFMVFKDETQYKLHKKFVDGLVQTCFSMSAEDLENIFKNNFFSSSLLNYKMTQELNSNKSVPNKNKI